MFSGNESLKTSPNKSPYNSDNIVALLGSITFIVLKMHFLEICIFLEIHFFKVEVEFTLNNLLEGSW